MYRHAFALVAAALALSLIGPVAHAAEPSGVTAKVVSQEALPNSPGNSLTAVVVDLAPGASAPAHHHAGFVLAYVLSGTVRSALNKGEPKDFHAGQSWVEPPGTEHTLTANPSRTESASLLAVFVAPTGANLTTYNK
jgi:quercetin dioxygenase-like cupin family protein